MNSEMINNNTCEDNALPNNRETGGLSKELPMRGILVVIGTLLISAIGFFGIKMPYASPTDTLLTLALGGCDGPGAPQFLCSYHMNTLFSFFLYLIRRTTGAFNVYGFTLIALLTLAFCLLQIEASDRDPAAHLMIAVVQILCMRYLTYTVVAYIAMSAGILCRSSEAKRQTQPVGKRPDGKRPDGKRPAAAVCCSWILMLSGASLRYDVVMTALAVLLPTLLYVLTLKGLPAKDLAPKGLTLKRTAAERLEGASAENENALLKSSASGLPAMFAAAVVLWVTVSMVINPLMYRSQGAEWADYYEYDKQSLRIRDGSSVSYDEYRDVMDEIGWSRNDLNMAHTWMFSDLDVFGTQKLKAAADAVRLADKFDLDLPDLTVKFFTTPMAVGYLFICCIAMGIAIRRARLFREDEDLSAAHNGRSPAANNRRSSAAAVKWHLVILLLAALLPCFMWSALYVRQRFVDRVAVPFLAIGILQFTELLELYFHCTGLKAADKRCSLAAITILFCVVAAGKICAAPWASADRNERLAFRQYLDEHSEEVFITAGGVLNKMTVGLPAVDTSPEADYSNVIRLGSQQSFSGSYYERCRRLGVPDPDHLMKNLILSEDLSGDLIGKELFPDDRRFLLIASRKAEAENIRIFLEEHYGYSGGYTKLAEILPGVIVYRFQ